MEQLGFFDLEDCYAELSRNGDPLEDLAAAVPWEAFRYRLNKALKRAEKDASKGGRPPFDEVLMFKILVLQSLYGLSDDQTEYQIRDWLSFRCFLGISMGGQIIDASFVHVPVRRGAAGAAGMMVKTWKRKTPLLRASRTPTPAGQRRTMSRTSATRTTSTWTTDSRSCAGTR